MIHLYGMGSPNVVKVFIMLEETGLPYRYTRVNVMAGEQFSSDFLALNPNAKVPVIVDESEPGDNTVVFESGAILSYLAEKTGVLWPGSFHQRTEVNQWLMFQMASFGPMAGQAIHFAHAVKDQEYGRNRYGNELARLINVVETRLAACPFMAGDAYSLADIALHPWIRTLRMFFPEQLAGQAALTDWYERIMQRPAVDRAVSRVQAMSDQDIADIRNADKPARDRYFNRVPRQPASR